jgi:hypothetical protein
VSGAICLILAILQGKPRPYTLIPLFIGAIACSLEGAFARTTKPLVTAPQAVAAVRQIVFLGGVTAIAVAVLLGDTGLLRALLMKYFWNQAEYARIGPVPEDEYMSWVKTHVADSEEIEVIALGYGGTSAFDPVLSTIRLGRRVNSATPILHFPLRAALVSGDRDKIDAAWTALIDEISTTRPTWIVIRRITSLPVMPDFVKTIEAEPRFYGWLTKHYSQYDTFGPYVAYRRSG